MSMTHTKKYTDQDKYEVLYKDPKYGVFLKSTEFKDLKCDMDMDMKNMVVIVMDV